MKISKGLCLASAVALVVSCFFPWVTIESKSIIVSGVDSTGTSFGKPGYFHIFLAFFYLLLLTLSRTWAKNIAIFFSAFNVAWAIRNFIIISTCYGGVCPQKHGAIYVMVFASIAMLIAVLFYEPQNPGKDTAD